MLPARLSAVPAGERPGDRPTPAPRRRHAPRLTASMWALVLIATGCFGFPHKSEGLSAGMALPWPRDGQARVVVEGLGDLGGTGEPEPVPIASLTKVMTAYVILREHPLKGAAAGPVIEVDRQAAEESLSREESSAPVREGQRFTERQMLELMLIPSGNNIARLLARWDSGTQEAFVAKMNRAAAGLGMTRTTYTGASGIEPTTVSTAADQLKLARRVMKDPVIRSIVAKPEVTIPGVPGAIVNTNALLGKSGVIGLKTGSSTPAGGALMWAAEAMAGGRTWLILGVVLHQSAGSPPAIGLRAALDRSRELVDAVRGSLGSLVAAREAGR
ncbi:D-alanyl-D-alanine carboxypeptidase [Microbispora rosea subsp. aerata]|nr:D-alanyl-D-alanine carboxypeptidase [Microbispora rosea]GGO17455.1 D-alanyl-D-alanine carboxypeptidase [Microbispora rosea subsp. aerata]GIH56547.1 D-alanyl-D-alanine carboxypeptidase [Microbispora rosea subsp. aerata]GLJ81924.1 D-alanyl-D-alanine carboxypeptidase [Microbispora rosea subsp. aerata]